MLVIGIVAAAHAGVWEPGEARPLGAAGAASDAVVAPFDGSPAVFVGGPDGVAVRAGPELAEVAALALPVADLHVTDLDGDGTVEVLACGPSGLHVVRASTDVFAEPIGLSELPCVSVASFRPPPVSGLPALDHLVTWTGEGLQRFRPGGDGLIAEPVELPEGFGVPRLAGNGSRWAAAGSSLITVDGEAREERPLDGVVAGLAPDGDGFAVALGAPPAAEGAEPGVPKLVLGDGSEVPLPGAPRWAADPGLTGDGDLWVGLPDRSVLLRLGPDGEPRVTAMPARADVVASGDLDGDRCADLFVLASDGSEGAVLTGVCPPPPVSGTLTLGAEWAQLATEVGVTTRVQLVDGVRGWTGFERRGGPDGVTVLPDGRLEFTPAPSDVGIWRLSVRITDGTGERWSGVVVRVRGDASEPTPIQVPAIVQTVDETEPGDRNNVVARSRRSGFLGVRECLASAGVAAGASRNQGLAWSNIGLPDVVPSASPAVALACGGGSDRVHVLFGVDSAPTFFYLGKNGRLNHVLAGTLGLELRAGDLRFGPIVNAGIVVLGVGARAVVLPFETKEGGKHGFEVRALAYPLNLSGQGMLAYTWEFGDFR